MAKLHFYYSTMNAGKSTLLLQINYNNSEKKIHTILFLPDVASSDGIITSRLGLFARAMLLYDNLNLFKYIKSLSVLPKLILVDEAQFLKKKQVFELIAIVDILNINIFTYGLRTDFRGKLFDGSKYLLALSDKIIEIKSICFCGNKATMTARVENAKRQISGNQIDLSKKKYMSFCRYHYYNI
ncbi:MAG TPA: thymidine kinase [Candidatus Azoamicus sp. OHIO2]